MKEKLIKGFLTYLVNAIAILFFFMNFAKAETIILGDYPHDREPGWSNECQGVTHDESYWYVTQRDRLWKFSVYFDLNQDVPANVKRVGIPEYLKKMNYDHFGDLDFYKGYLFIPLEDKRYSQPKIVMFKAQDLSFVAEGNLDVTQGGGHTMACAINPLNGLLHVSQYKDGDPSSVRIFVYQQEIKNGKLILRYLKRFQLYEEDGKTALNPGSIQGFEFSKANGLLYLVSDTGSEGGIFIFDQSTGKRLQRITIAYDPDYGLWTKEELEGITIWDLDNGHAPNIKGQVHLIMIDNVGVNDDDLYFKHFRVPGDKQLTWREDCLSVNHSKLEVRKFKDYYQLDDGKFDIIFKKLAEAQKARMIINYYKINEICFVGRPNSSMNYYLVNDKSPVGSLPGEDCIGFDPSRVEMKWIGGRWKIVEGDHHLVDFGGEGLECLAALHFIKKYGFTNRCFVGRPDPSMAYFRK